MSLDQVSTAVRSGPIAVVPYDPHWPIAFEHIRDTLAHALGEIAFDAHHIGSTAVPGLCAKPKIDIDVVVRSADDIAKAVDRLKTTDRDDHGDPYNDGMWTFTSRRGVSPGHRIYVCAPNTPAHLDRILFRDHLRAHPEAAAAYGALKRRLVTESQGVWQTYTDGKSAFVADIVERARSQGTGGVRQEAPHMPHLSTRSR